MKKRLLVLLMAGCMVCSIAACGSKKDAESTEVTENTESTESTADESAVGTSKITKLGEYKGLTYTAYDTVVTDEEVEAEVQYLVSNSTMKKSQETATETSVVNIDYVGTKDGVAFEGGTAQAQELDLGNSTYIAGFAESIVGMKVGETKDCPMTFPENYGVEELNGAEVVFTITVNECWENVPAQLNDEFAVSQGYENVEALYDGMRQLCELVKQQNAQTDMKTQLVEQMISGTTFDITEEETQYYVDRIYSEYEMYASYYGYDMENYVQNAVGIPMEEFEVQCREEAVYNIQTTLLQKAIVEAESIVITDEIYNQKAAEYSAYFGYETVGDFEAAYSKELIETQILADLAMEIVVENAVEEK